MCTLDMGVLKPALCLLKMLKPRATERPHVNIETKRDRLISNWHHQIDMNFCMTTILTCPEVCYLFYG